MTRIGILLGGIALAAASAGHAQLLGGGGIGGMVGGVGGGGMGGVTGNLGGGLGGSLGRVDGDVQGSLRSQQLRDAAHLDRVRAREARAAAKAARRNPALAMPAAGSAAAGTPMASAMGSATGVRTAVMGSAATQPLQASAGGMLDEPRSTTARAIEGVRGRSFAARAEVEAGQRGLRRVGRSVSGVAVYVPALAVGTSRAIYGGDGTFVYGGGVYDGGYYGGPVPAPVPVDDRQYRELQRAAAGTGVTVERRGADLVLELHADITFAFDRADIQPRFVPALDAVARTIAAYPATDVEVIGHTDAVGTDAYNFALSQRRGASVADFLVNRHTDAERLVVEGLGKTEPIASNATIAGRAANRRVEIVLHGEAA